eukprot:355205-Chlamydomonas_euryale.AAC.4
MDHGPRQCHKTAAVQKSSLTGAGWCDFDVRPGRQQDRCHDVCYGRQAAGGRRQTRLPVPRPKTA